MAAGGGVDKGISGAGIGGSVRSGGPTPCVVESGTGGAPVTGSLRSKSRRLGASACGAGRVVLRARVAGVWRESDGGVR